MNWENTAYWGEFKQSEALASTFGLFQIQMRGLGGVATPGKLYNFYPHLNLETRFSELKLTQNCYININISFFFEKWQFNHISGHIPILNLWIN